MKVIAFINFKGGVGKTSNAVNLAACLAKFHHKRVLLVDLDAQCNATGYLLRREERERQAAEPQHSVFQIYRDFLIGSHGFDFDASVLRGYPRSPEGNPYLPTLDLLPATVELLDIEDQIGGRTSTPYFTWLEKALRDASKEYDYVFLDCPPHLHAISKSALYFADYYVIPYIPDFLSLSGFRVFAKVVKRFQDQVSGFRPKHARARIVGAIVNRFKNRVNILSEGVGLLELELRDLKAEGLVHESARIFDPFIRDCVGVAACTNHHLPVILYDEACIGALDYTALAEDFVNHLESLS